MGIVLVRDVMRAALALSGVGAVLVMGVLFARSGRRPLTRMGLGRLIPAGNVTADAPADELRLLQRVWYSSDAQNEHEKGHGKNDAHVARQ
jgi:hypothetical protein